MENTNKETSNKGCLLGGLVGGLITSIILLVIFALAGLMIISSMSIETDKAKENTIRSNVMLIRNEVLIKLNRDDLDPKKAIAQSIDDLNTNKDLNQEFSPFSNESKPFASELAPGVVVVKLVNDNTIRITGYDKDNKELLHKDLVKGE